MLKQMLVCSLSALLLTGCSSEETVPKKVVKPIELPLTLKMDESKEHKNPNKIEFTYTISGQSNQPLYLTGTEYFHSGEQKIWFTKVIQPGQYEGKKLKLGEQFDTAKGYRSFMYDLDGTMQTWSEQSEELKDFLYSSVSFREKTLLRSDYQVLMLEQSSIHQSKRGNQMDQLDAPQDVKLSKGERIFIISLSTKPVRDIS
ncbi:MULTISPECIES: hypothetical protein [unclassified Exiguobacterium]|uniref:hypothetical protein n=1 Tax=unclassified Exiguobacterium TaxID=2644629 RepID=UPI001BE6BDF6|nr:MULTISPECIES: hypothetical protein [unclassified Exiguobacterium]